MNRAGFDPRYSAEFQRGFNPAALETPSETAEAPQRVGPVPEPVAQRLTPTPPPVRQVPSGPVATDVLAPGEAPVSEKSDAETVPGSPWRNPYLVGLTVLGVVLIGGGIGAFRWSVEQVFGGAIYAPGATVEEIEESMLAAQLAWGLAPLVALVGVLTLVGVFFVVAWRWRPRQQPDGDDDDGEPTPF